MEDEERPIRINWLFIFATIVFLIVLGWLFGLLAKAPNGQTIDCEKGETIQTADAGDHFVAYCD